MEMAKDYYEKFLRERSGDSSLMAELAWSHYQLAEIRLRQARERLLSALVSPPPPVPPASTDHPPPAPRAGRRDPMPAPNSPNPFWDADLAEAARNNNDALSLYRQLVEHRHAPKVREYQLCREQQRLLERIRHSQGPSEAAVILNEALTSYPPGPGLGGGLAAAHQVFSMIGD
jgi:hypothetical protein